MPTPDDFNSVKMPGYNAGRDDSMIPCNIPSKQFSSDKDSDPETLLKQTKSCVEDHSSLVNAYGYNMPVATLGSHPWLRDELADLSEMEPGNAQPGPGLKYPGGGKS